MRTLTFLPTHICPLYIDRYTKRYNISYRQKTARITGQGTEAWSLVGALVFTSKTLI